MVLPSPARTVIYAHRMRPAAVILCVAALALFFFPVLLEQSYAVRAWCFVGGAVLALAALVLTEDPRTN
jgi:peptidoglycan/LPS O-acetylase OafA/YrhL